MTAREALEFLASRRRTVLLGGAAVILHGMNRMVQGMSRPLFWRGIFQRVGCPRRHLLIV